MMRAGALLVIAGLAAGCTGAGGHDQLAAGVDRRLLATATGLDVSDLSHDDLVALHALHTGQASTSEKIALTRSIVGGRNSLRGALLD